MDLIRLKNSAVQAALSAGKYIQSRMHEDVSVNEKKGINSAAAKVVTEVDIECEKIILPCLLPSTEEFDLALLTEEMRDDGSRFEKDFFWCIDPMDGTLSFINKQPGFSVSIALVRKDGTPIIGVIYDPSTEVLYHAIKEKGAFRNNEAWEIKHKNAHLTYVTDKLLSNTPNKELIENTLNNYVQELNLVGTKEMSGGGSVMNAMYVLENGPACLIKLPKKEKGGGSLWDFAASACIFQELGLDATNFNGEPLDLNRLDDSFMNHQGVFYKNLKQKN